MCSAGHMAGACGPINSTALSALKLRSRGGPGQDDDDDGVDDDSEQPITRLGTVWRAWH
jgi:hypothetical protein